MTVFRSRNPATVEVINPALYQVIAVKRTSPTNQLWEATIELLTTCVYAKQICFKILL